MFIHLRQGAVGYILHLDYGGPKMDRLDGVVHRVPVDVPCSIFNDIRPIRDWWIFHLNDGHWLFWTRAWAIRLNGGHLNNGHWLIRTQAWAISAKDRNVAIFQWSIT